MLSSTAALAAKTVHTTTSVVSAILDETGALGDRGGIFNLAALPLYVRDLIFLGHLDPEEAMGGVSGGGAAALCAYLAVLGVSVWVLIWRYRQAE